MRKLICVVWCLWAVGCGVDDVPPVAEMAASVLRICYPSPGAWAPEVAAAVELWARKGETIVAAERGDECDVLVREGPTERAVAGYYAVDVGIVIGARTPSGGRTYVIAHEIGHALGYAHDESDWLMRPGEDPDVRAILSACILATAEQCTPGG